MNKISIYNKVAAVTNSPSAAPSAHMAHAESAEYAKAASLRPQLAAAPSVFSRMASTSEASATLCSLRPLRETKKSTRENPRLTKSQRPIANSLFRKAATFIFALSSFTLITSCTEDDLVTQTTPLAPQGTKTVTVDFQLPEGKPGFEGQSTDDRVQSTEYRVQSTDSRGQIAETSAATDGLCTLYSELCTLNATRATATSWADWAEGDELMMKITVKGFDDKDGYAVYESYMMLAYESDGKWDMLEDKSTTVTENSPVANPDYVMLAQTTDIDLTQPLSIKVPEDMSLDMTIVSVTYAPELEWDITPDANGAVTDVNRKLKATATTTAPECWEVSSGEWSTNQARLRVNTGAAGDVVTLTSEKFYPNSIGMSADGIYTATTDADGDAYFYGEAGTIDDSDIITATTSGFNLSLTAVTMRDGDAAFTYHIAPVTLLEASTLVPVQLVGGNSYRLDATEKRTAVTNTIAVIDGTCGNISTGTEEDVAAVKAAIAGKSTVIVTGETLAAYINTSANTVVGEAIRQLAEETTVSLVLPAATTIGEYAFQECIALTSVSLPAAETIRKDAFFECTSLESVSLPAATTIGESAFSSCTSLKSVSLPAATSIGINAFNGCTALESVSLPEAEKIGNTAFRSCSALTSVSLPAATTIGVYAFMSCSALKSVSLPAAETIGEGAFWSCALKSLTFGSVITSVGEYAFYNVPPTNCDLTLNSDQKNSTDENLAPSGRTWAGYTWKSITLVNSN